MPPWAATLTQSASDFTHSLNIEFRQKKKAGQGSAATAAYCNIHHNIKKG